MPMLTDLLNIEIAGLHLLHWLLSAFLPAVLAGLSISYMIITYRMQRKARRLIIPLIRQLDDLVGRTFNHLGTVSEIFDQCPDQAFRFGFQGMKRECTELYQGRWLPDPANHLNVQALFGPARADSLRLAPAIRLLAVGLLGSLASLLVQTIVPVMTVQIGLGFILLPGIFGLAGGLLAAASAISSGNILKSLLEDLHHSLENRLPVYSDNAGMALLIDRFLEYDRQMKHSLEEFNATASRLAESEMADGIRHSVEQVMLGSVAPAIQQATSTLGSLAGELTNRQERGMQDLAVRFANALSSDLAGHLQPINKEIDLMRALMVDVKNYIEIAMRSLETTRQQSEGLLSDTRKAFQQMAGAQERLAADFNTADSQIQALAAAAGSMATLYEGNERNLALNIASFGDRLDHYGQQLGSILNEAITAMQAARQLAADQQDSAGLYLGAMQDQVNNLTTRLGVDVQALLGQIRQETGAVASHAGAIGTQLSGLNSTLRHSLDEFTVASAQYVRQTLNDFDGGLAELAERMARTASEIRDAVDALPAALRQAPKFDG